MARRRIEADEIGQVKAMVASGMSNKRVATQMGMSRDTVRRYAAGEHPQAVSESDIALQESTSRDRIKDNVERFLVKASDIASSDEFVGEMSRKPKDLLIGLGIGIEKMELLSGRATSRTLNVSVSYLAPTALRDLSSNLIEGTFAPIDVPQTAQPQLQPGETDPKPL